MKKIFLPILLLALSVFSLQAQTWTIQTSPVATDINSAWAVNDQVCWMCGPAGLVIKTVNGVTWALANTGLAGNDFYTISAVDANICIVGAGDGGLWRTVNGGTSWTFITLTPPGVFINVVHMFNATSGFAMSDPVGGSWKWWKTADGGVTWTAGATIPAVGAEAGWNNSYDALPTGEIWWGTNVTKIWKGSMTGTWTSAPTPGRLNSFGVAFNNTTVGTACFQTLSNMVSADGGTSWTAGAVTPTGTPFALKSIKGTGYMFMGTATTISRSLNSGASFSLQLTLPANTACYALTFVHQQYGWAGTQGGKIYRYVDITGIDPNNNNVPNAYALQQNYPNPFNPSTTIKYSLPNSSFVTLNIYDALGNLIKTVVSGSQTAGNYVEEVDMSSFASGIYFYSLNAGSFTETKKMTLIK